MDLAEGEVRTIIILGICASLMKDGSPGHSDLDRVASYLLSVLFVLGAFLYDTRELWELKK